MRKEVRMSLNPVIYGADTSNRYTQSYADKEAASYVSPYEKEKEAERKERMGIKDPIQEAIDKQRAPKEKEDKNKVDPLSKDKTKTQKNSLNKTGKSKQVHKTGKTDKHGHVKGDPNYECETCKNRKYQDGSDEMVSFKTAQHMSPTEAGNRVRAHEQEHVSNAYTKAAKNGGKVLQASVQIHTAICPECGRTYVSGGLTTTRIKYNNNPYDKARKLQDSTKVAGRGFQVTT